ncbi:MAG: hypothetical protein KAS19_06695, partial [Anaerolineales bacterium]|nr:hypothetical protein [Anaerolineales bacterium]
HVCVRKATVSNITAKSAHQMLPPSARLLTFTESYSRMPPLHIFGTTGLLRDFGELSRAE